MKHKLTARAIPRLVFGGTLFLAFVCATVGQSQQKLRDAGRLRDQFVATFGKDFDLAKSEFKTRSNERGGGTYWLAYLAPKRTGYFYLQHSYKPNDKLYSHVEQEIHLGVGPKSCRRGAPYSGTYSRFCLGDTIILPMLINDFIDHDFKLVKADYSQGDKDWETFDDAHPEMRDLGLDKTPLANPAGESLRYIGRSSRRSLHRSLGYTLQWHAEFEAIKPGKFNLTVSSASPAATSAGASGSVPIIVVARGTPVTLIAGHEEVRGFRMGYDGREWLSSTSGNNYITDVMILQPGDRVSFAYFRVVRGREFEKGERGDRDRPDPVDDVKPVISKHPFSLDAQFNFNEWLIDLLPG